MCHPYDSCAARDRGDLREELEITRVGDSAMPAVLHRAEVGDQRGGVLLISDIYGITPFYDGIAGRLADAGYTTLLPNYFFREGPLEEITRDLALARGRRVDQLRALEDHSDALRHLSGELVDKSRVGVLGFCLGGTFAFNLAAQRKDLVVLSYYGFPAGFEGHNPMPAPETRVEEISGPILAMWGAEEYMDMEGVRAFCQAMEGRDVEYESLIYPGVGHGFLGDLDEGGEAATDSWKRSLEFLEQHLAATAGAV